MSKAINEQAQWKEHSSPEGIPYWFNTVSKVSTWEKPESIWKPEDRIIAACMWKEYTAPNGYKYYHSSATLVTTWEKPKEFKEMLEKVHRIRRLRGEDENGNPLVGNTQNTEAFPNYADAETTFMAMLENANISPYSTWQEALRSVIMNPQYKSLVTVGERKEAIIKFLEQKRKSAEEEKRLNAEINRENFKNLLAEKVDIYSARYQKYQAMFENESRWICIPERERRELFDNYVNEQRRIEKITKMNERKIQMDVLTKILKDYNVVSSSDWLSTLQFIQNHELYKELMSMSKLDLLDAFEDHIKNIERNLNIQRTKEREERERKERKNRDNFKELLLKLRKEKSLDVYTPWKDIYVVIKDTVEFNAMLEQFGSTPMDLYRDYIVELEDEIYRERKLLNNYLIERKASEIKANTSYDTFCKILETPLKGGVVNPMNVKIIYDIFISKAKKKENKPTAKTMTTTTTTTTSDKDEEKERKRTIDSDEALPKNKKRNCSYASDEEEEGEI
jgi:pre-mRNA-processing factor 40